MPKVIIFDLDGTLTESKQPLSPKMGEVLKRLLDKAPVGIMSGADLPQFEKQLLPFLPEDANLSNLFLFPTSAAECLEYKQSIDGGQWIPAYDYLFSEKEKEKITEAVEKVAEESGYLEGEPQFGERVEDRGEQITWSALGQEAPLNLKEIWDPDHKKRQLLREKLLEIIPEFEISIGGSTSIDITHKDISKEDGIRWLEQKFGIDSSEMLYVGDALFEGGNDAEVKKTNVQTRQVSGPKETMEVIEGILTPQIV